MMLSFFSYFNIFRPFYNFFSVYHFISSLRHPFAKKNKKNSNTNIRMHLLVMFMCLWLNCIISMNLAFNYVPLLKSLSSILPSRPSLAYTSLFHFLPQKEMWEKAWENYCLLCGRDLNETLRYTMQHSFNYIIFVFISLPLKKSNY